MKKKIALYLALLFCFNTLASVMGPTVQVNAANQLLYADMYRQYQFGTGTSNPVPSTGSINAQADQVSFYWNLDGAKARDHYTLTGYLNNNGEGRKVTVNVTYNGENMLVDYDLFDFDGTTWVNVTDAYKPGTGPVSADSNIQYAVNLPQRSPVPIEIDEVFTATAFTNNAIVNNRDPYDANYPLNANLTLQNIQAMSEAEQQRYFRSLSPSFTIQQNNGFSFTYYGGAISFMWQANNDFWITIDQLNPGYVYPFTLDHKSGTDRLSVFNGIDTSSFVAIPLAGGDPQKTPGSQYQAVYNDELASKIGLEPDFIYADPENAGNAFDVRVVDLTTGQATAEEELGVSLRFDLPSYYDAASNIFKPIDSGFTERLTVQLLLGGTTVTLRELQLLQTSAETTGSNLTIDNTLIAGSTSVRRVSFSSDISYLRAASRVRGFVNDTDTARNRTNTSRVEVLLSGMDKGSWVSSINFAYPETSANLVARESTNVASSYRAIYTFFDLDVQPIGGDLYLGVSALPNSKAGDQYRLLSSTLPNATYYEQSNFGKSREIIVTYEGGDKIWFPLDISAKNPASRLYQVQYATGKFSDDSSAKYVYSQIVQYLPSTQDASIGTPNNFQILKGLDFYDPRNPVDKGVKLYPLPYGTSGEQGLVEFWSQWDIADQDDMHELLRQSADQTLYVEYELYYGLTPTIQDPLGPTPDLLDTITMEIKSTGTTTTSPSALTVQYSDVPGDPNTAPFIVNSTAEPLKNSGTTYFADIHFKVDAALGIPVPAAAANLYYPNIYFMYVTPIRMYYTKPDGTLLSKDLGNMDSLIDTMTLDDISPLAPPPPQNMTVTAYTVENGFPTTKPALEASFTIPGNAIREYMASIYPYPSQEVTLNLYVGQNEDAIKDAFYAVTKTLTERQNLVMPPMLDYQSAVNADGVTFNLSSRINDLRSNRPQNANAPNPGVLCITNIPLLDSRGAPLASADMQALLNGGHLDMSLYLEGLDQNQSYYVFADLVVTNQQGTQAPIQDYSMLSNLDGTVTASELNELDPAERTPPAPYLWADQSSTQQTLAAIFWNRITPDPNETINTPVTINYEIIRTKDSQMAPDSLYTGTDASFTGVLSQMTNKDVEAWQTQAEATTLSHYDKASGKFVPVTTSDQYLFDGSGNPLSLADSTLVPNQIYFYYVRTVREVEVNGVMKKTVSTWSRVTVTTLPTQSPTNLRIENSRPDYNRQTEVMFSFELPTFQLSSLGVDYQLQYQIKPDGGEWSDITNMDDMTQFSNPDNVAISTDGLTMRITYKVSGLKANTLYTLRVRLYDLRTKDGSLFSNIVQFKTDIDQGDYDDDHYAQEWIDFLQKQLEQLLKDPYWLAQDSSNSLVVVLRPGSMFNAILNSSPDAAVTLYNHNVDYATYYIPASVLQTVNNAGKGFRILYDDAGVLLSPKFINPDYNEAVSTLKGYITDKTASDYFVRIDVARDRIGGLVEGETALSKRMNVTIDLVGLSPDEISIQAWDNSLYAEFTAIVDAYITDPGIRNELIRQVQSGAVSEELLDYIDEVAADAKNDLLKSMNDRLRTTGNGILSTRTASVAKLDAPMVITAKVSTLDTATRVNGYQLQHAVWMPRTVSDYASGKGMSVNTPGSFIFTGRTVNIPGIDDTADGGTIQALAAKYGLDDYLGKDAINVKQNATRLMVAGCIARIAGAPKTDNPVTWIASNLNMTLSSRNTAGQVQNQEALAMLMALYEKKTNTPVSSIMIRNYANTAGMTGLDNRYAQAVRAAYEVGLVSDTALQPTGPVTVGQLLNMLAALDRKVKL